MGKSCLKLEFSNKVKEYRLRENFTQSDLACLVGVSKNTISNIEVGNCIPSCELGLKIAIVLGVNFDDIFYLSLGKSFYTSFDKKVGEI